MSSDRIEAPVWEQYDKKSWKSFLRSFKTYKAKGGKIKVKALIHDCNVGMLLLEFPGLDIANSSDDELIDAIGVLWAPTTMLDAQEELTRLKMIGQDHSSLTLFCQDFHEELAGIPEEVRPPGKSVTKIFVDRLKPHLLKKMTAARGFEDVDDAMLFAMRQSRQNRSFYSMIQDQEKSAPRKREDASDMSLKNRNQGSRPNRQQSSRTNNTEIVCYNCGGKGHKSPVCPKPRNPNSRFGPNSHPRSGGSVKTVVKRHTVTTKKPVPSVHNVIAKKVDGRRINMSLFSEGQSGMVTTLIDTGADFNIIHPDIVAQFEEAGIVTIKTPIQFTTAGGAMQAPYQVVLTVEVTQGTLVPVRIKTVFAVCDCGENLLLGYPWLTQHGLDKIIEYGEEDNLENCSNLDESDAPREDVETYWDSEELDARTATILEEFQEVFGPLGVPAKVPTFAIDLEPNADMPRMKPRRMSPDMRKELGRQVQEQLDQHIIRPSTSAFASPVVMQKKRNGEYRLCVDYRKLNDATKVMAIPMPNGKDVLYRMQGSAYFARIDMKKGFHQIAMAPDSIQYTAFATPDGLFEYTCMPFGLKNPSGFFQATMERVLAGLPKCEIYVDDILIHGRTEEEYLHSLSQVLKRLRDAGFRLNREKCAFGLRTVGYIGHVISAAGVTLSEERKDAVRRIPVPTTVKQVRSFLGFINYFRDFVPDMATLSKPLYELTKKGVKFVWTASHEIAFERLKQATADSTRLRFPLAVGTIVLRTDASDVGIGAHLVQKTDADAEHTLAFFSQVFSPTQQRWSTIEQEAYAIFAAIKHWDHFVWGRRFEVETDHRNLVFIHRCLAAKVIRWRLQLQEYDFIIRHIPGSVNVVADFLSRFSSDSPAPEKSAAVMVLTPEPDMEPLFPAAPMDVDLPTPSATPPQSVFTADAAIVEEIDASADEDSLDAPAPPIEPSVSTAPTLPVGSPPHASQVHVVTSSVSPDTAASATVPGAAPPSIRPTHARRRLADRPPSAAMTLPEANEPDTFREHFDVVHNNIVGHLGVAATMDRLAARGFFRHTLRRDVGEAISSCAVCQKIRLGQGSVIAAVRTTTVQQPFQHLMWDTVGPLPRTEHGFEYVLVIIDRFTRFIELIPTVTVSAREAAGALLQICGRYGVFSTIHSDRGRQFDAALVRHLCTLLHIGQQFGPPYRPQAQGTVERSNRETLRHLRAMMTSVSSSDLWADSLPMVQRIYNSLPNRLTGIAPARLLYGDAVNMDRQLLLELPESTDTTTYEAYLTTLLTNQRILVQASAAHQLEVAQRALARAPEHPTEYHVGDLVLVLPGDRTVKLKPRWFGPMAVVSRTRDSYNCQDLNNGKIKTLHVSRLKTYVEDPTVDSADAALWDSEVTLVDFIIAHRMGRTPAKWMFKVRWLDYGPDHDSWEPYRSVKLTTAFARYIRDNQLAAFSFAAHPLDDHG